MGPDETVILEACLLLYRGPKSKKSADHSTEMNADVFLLWLGNEGFPKITELGKKYVLYRATYHTVPTPETRPMRASYKKVLPDAIERWGGPPESWPEDWERKKFNAHFFLVLFELSRRSQSNRPRSSLIHLRMVTSTSKLSSCLWHILRGRSYLACVGHCEKDCGLTEL